MRGHCNDAHAFKHLYVLMFLKAHRKVPIYVFSSGWSLVRHGLEEERVSGALATALRQELVNHEICSLDCT